MNIKKWIISNKYHFIIWVIFMAYEIATVGALYMFGNPLTYALHYLVVIVFFYLNADFALPWIFKSKNVFLKLPLMIVVELCLYIIMHHLVDRLLLFIQILKDDDKTYIMSSTFILRNFYRGIYFLGFSTGYFFTKRYINERKKTAELEREKLNDIIKQQQIEQQLAVTQNAFLKAQINPHFLFNTLDFVYYHTNLHSPIAGEAIIKLSQMMRFAIDSDKMGDFISLAEEIEQVENLIYLHEIRKKDQPCIIFSYEDEAQAVKIIPLVLLTLVENIFKHGDLSEPNDMALVAVTIKNQTLHIKTDNLINRSKSLNSNNAGLQNIKKRLNYAYGTSANFTYRTDDRNHFIVNLTIKLP